jgi:hypothetical protein
MSKSYPNKDQDSWLVKWNAFWVSSKNLNGFEQATEAYLILQSTWYTLS